MKVLLSIKPEYAGKIFGGEKKFEFRRSIFKNPDTTHVVVYASYPIQKVIGEFEIEDIVYESVSILWKLTHEYSGISKEKFLKYFSNKEKGYAIKIGRLIEYNEPLSLKAEFGLSPPQSFVYL
jgi:predicted transcriptional regulator